MNGVVSIKPFLLALALLNESAYYGQETRSCAEWEGNPRDQLNDCGRALFGEPIGRDESRGFSNDASEGRVWMVPLGRESCRERGQNHSHQQTQTNPMTSIK
jgi:hypothetical protein